MTTLAPLDLSRLSVKDYLGTLQREEMRAMLSSWPRTALHDLANDAWPMIARPEQQLDWFGDWKTWLLHAGRRFGKTRTGAEAINAAVLKHGVKHILLIGQTLGDAADVMVNGPSGIIEHSGGTAQFKASNYGRPSVMWENGAEAYVRSAENANNIRGLGVELIWADELGQFATIGKGEDDAWAMAKLALDHGVARKIVTTTPKRGNRQAQRELREMVADRGNRLTIGSTDDNRANLSPELFREFDKMHGGTLLEKQERHGVILEEVEGSLWSRPDITEAFCIPEDVPPWDLMDYKVIAIDPAVSASVHADYTAIVAAGRMGEDAYILRSAGLRCEPVEWALLVEQWYHEMGINEVLYERNGIGALTPEVLMAAEVDVPARGIQAVTSKGARAWPIVGLYQQRRIWHAGEHDLLEQQMMEFTGDPQTQVDHDDMVDAMVYATRDLLLREQALGIEAL